MFAPLPLPVHGFLRRRVNRWTHGVGVEPWDELGRLGERLAAVSDADDVMDRVLPEVLAQVRRALRASSVRLHLADATAFGGGERQENANVRSVTVPLKYAGQALGDLTVVRAGGFAGAERELLDQSAAIAQRVLAYFAAGSVAAATPFPELTDREREVLDLVARGLTKAEIAPRLVVSDKAVRNHVSNVFAKLHVTGRAEAVARARDAGLGAEEQP